MDRFWKISWGFISVILLLPFIRIGAMAQSYDVSDSLPPRHHAERTPLFMPNPWFEKYNLYIDQDCHTGDLIIDIRLSTGSRPFKIEILSDDSIIVTLSQLSKSPGGRASRLRSDVRISPLFTLLVIKDNDTAVYEVVIDSKEFAPKVRPLSANNFIKLQPILEIPKGIICVYDRAGNIGARTLRRLRVSLAEKKIRYFAVEEGYYRCLGMISKMHHRNYSPDLGAVLFLETDYVHDPDSLLSVVKAYDSDLKILDWDLGESR